MKYADDSVILPSEAWSCREGFCVEVGLISPQLNANETKDMDMVIDYRRSPSSHLMTTTKGLDIEIVETHKYLVSSLTFYKIMF